MPTHPSQHPLTIASLIEALQQARSWQLTDGEAYHLVVVPEDVTLATREQFETVEALIARLHSLLGSPCQVFCYAGVHLPIIRKVTTLGTVRFLQTPEGKLPIAPAEHEEQEEIEESGFLGNDLTVAEQTIGGVAEPEEDLEEENEESDDDLVDDTFPDDDSPEEEPEPAPETAKRRVRRG